MRLVEQIQRRARAGKNGRPRSHAFEAITMERAHAGEARIEGMTPGVDMTDFRVHEAVNRCAVDEYAAADAGADGQVHEASHVPPGPPSMLGQGRRIDVGIEADWYAHCARQAARDVGAAPSLLRREPDESLARRILVELHRTEGGDADRREGAQRVALVAQEGMRHAERRRGISGGKALLRQNLAVLIANGADELGAAGFDGAV